MASLIYRANAVLFFWFIRDFDQFSLRCKIRKGVRISCLIAGKTRSDMIVKNLPGIVIFELYSSAWLARQGDVGKFYPFFIGHILEGFRFPTPFSSRDRINIKYVSCSITVRGW